MTLRIDDLPVDEKLKRIIKERKGVTVLYPPQEEAIRAGLLDGENLVIATSTATGKTFLAELAMVNLTLRGKRKAVMLVPLKALAHEKARDLKLYEDLGVKVAVSTGDYESRDLWLEKYDIIVSTYEKFDSLLRHRVRWLSQVGLLIVDEIHYISDERRGPIIESIIAKIRALKLDPQIVALSATVGNADEIAEWLHARLVKSSWRPVDLREGVYYDGKIHFADGEVRKVRKLKDPVIDLVVDCVEESGQVLVFTNSRSNTVKLASSIASFIASYSRKLVDPKETESIVRKIESVSSSKLLAENLARVVKYGVAFHHAGLESEVRSVLEEAYRSRIIKVVVATTTLAAGVNLPARRVIIHEYRRYEPGRGYEPIPVAEYKQMAGRAGRPGLDPYGEAVLIARKESEIEFLLDYYVKSSPEPVVSKFLSERSMYTQTLAVIASNYANTIDSILSFMLNTLAAHQRRVRTNEVLKKMLRDSIRRVVAFLEESEFVRVSPDGKIEPTELGSVVNLNYIDPVTASIYVKGLRERTTATDFAYINLIIKSSEVPKLRVRRGDVSKLLNILRDVYDSLLVKPTASIDELEELDEYVLLDLLEEIKTTCMINDWINEVDEDTLVAKYDIGPGDLRMYSETLEWLMHAASQLARTLGLMDHAENLEILKLRVKYGVKPELIELVQLEGVGRARARLLYSAGYKTIEDIAHATPSQLVSRVRGIGEKLARVIIESAREKMKRGYVKARVHPATSNSMRKNKESEKGKFTILDYLRER